MRVIYSSHLLTKVVKQLKQRKRKIGFVPTMGYLHAGHISLLRQAKKECDGLIISIFVNPKQFGPQEDFSRYPRDFARDKKLAKEAGVDILFTPRLKDIYPQDFNSAVEVARLTEKLCGPKRPGHFRGVTTIVAKLFNLVLPDIAYFGQKDYQQALVIKKMVKDLNFDLKIKVCPTIRENDGLALSSRNIYLNPAQRKKALALFKSLNMARNLIKEGEKDPKKIKNKMRKFLANNVDKIDYIEILKADDLGSLKTVEGKILIALACFVGQTRLIDNYLIRV